MAFYFRAQGRLVAHGLQVRAARNDTVGEFDFLLDAGPDGVEHIEFATKFYLLEGDGRPRASTPSSAPTWPTAWAPRCARSSSRQLALAAHPAAQAVLPRPVTRARALVKGWLFYPRGAAAGMDGIGRRTAAASGARWRKLGSWQASASCCCRGCNGWRRTALHGATRCWTRELHGRAVAVQFETRADAGAGGGGGKRRA